MSGGWQERGEWTAHDEAVAVAAARPGSWLRPRRPSLADEAFDHADRAVERPVSRSTAFRLWQTARTSEEAVAALRAAQRADRG